MDDQHVSIARTLDDGGFISDRGQHIEVNGDPHPHVRPNRRACFHCKRTFDGDRDRAGRMNLDWGLSGWECRDTTQCQVRCTYGAQA